MTDAHQPIHYTSHNPDERDFVHEPERESATEWTASVVAPSPTDAECTWVMARTVEWLNVFTDLLGLGDWKVVLTFDRSSLDHWATGCAMKVETDGWPYKQAKIIVFLGVVYDYTDAQIRHDIVHELTHLLVIGLQSWGPKKQRRDPHFTTMVERTTENIARGFLAAYEASAPETTPVFPAAKNETLSPENSPEYMG